MLHCILLVSHKLKKHKTHLKLSLGKQLFFFLIRNDKHGCCLEHKPSMY